MPVRPLIDSLLLYDPNRSSSTANVWVAHPSPSEEATFGKLFMVVSIDNADRLNHEIISALQEQLKFHYYHSTESKFSTAFEQALHQTNQHLHRLVIEGIDGWVERLHCLVGVIQQNQLIVSTAGRMMAFLLRRGRMHDMLGAGATAPNPLRIFSNIVEGQLTDQDSLLFCTPTVLDYFSLEKLRRTIIEHTPAESARLLETALLGSEQNIALGALMIRVEGTVESAPTLIPARPDLPRPSGAAPQRSMESLIARERATEQLLTPSIWPSIRDTINQVVRGVSSFVRIRILRRPPRRTLPQPLGGMQARTGTTRQRGPSLWVNIRGIAGLVYRFSRRALIRVTHIPRRFFRTPSRSASSPEWSERGPSWPNRIVNWWKSLRIQQKRFFAAGIVVFFIFVSVTVLRTNLQNPGSNGQSTTIVQIEDQLTKAEAALLYGGEDTARANLSTAASLIASLPNRTKTDKAQRAELTSRVETIRSQLARRVIVTNPEIVAQLAETAPTLRPQQLYWTGDLVFSYDPSKQTGVVLDIGTTDAPRIIRNTIDTGEPTTGTIVGNGLVLFSTERRGFVELNLTKETWRPIDATWPSGSYTVQSLSFFQNRVYALDRATGDIIRFSRGTSSLGTGSRWLKETTNLKLARALSVDGSIFILQPNGIVEEYFNGRKGEFTLKAIDPELKNPTRLWTSADVTRIYIVDPSNQRIIAFDKNGKLVRQYRSGSWTALADIAISESSKTALVLSGTTLYRLQLQD